MPIEAVSQTAISHVYTLTGTDDLNIAAGVTITSLTSDTVLANTGQHTITVSGTITAHDDGINTIGCDLAQTVIIAAGGLIHSGFDSVIDDSDGVILDGIGSTLINDGTILSHGSGLSLFVRDAGTTTITNNGQITADKFGIWNKFGIGILNVTNTGTIEGTQAGYFGGTAVDNLTNHGTFIGDVLLNGGDDVYVGTGGTVIGTINGGDGNDRFVLGNGVDHVDGGYGIDLLDFSAVTSALVVDLGNNSKNRGAAALGDTYTGIENVAGGSKSDVLRGNSFDNELTGNGGSDKLYGGAGDDILIGGTGRDILSGGAGRDIFVFNAVADLRDSIIDFTVGEDLIRLEGGAFGLGTYAGGLDPERFVTSTTNEALDANDHFIFRTTDATLWYDRDGSGSKAAILIADLNDGILLTAANIDII